MGWERHWEREGKPSLTALKDDSSFVQEERVINLCSSSVSFKCQLKGYYFDGFEIAHLSNSAYVTAPPGIHLNVRWAFVSVESCGRSF